MQKKLSAVQLLLTPKGFHLEFLDWGGRGKERRGSHLDITDASLKCLYPKGLPKKKKNHQKQREREKSSHRSNRKTSRTMWEIER